MYDPKIGRWIGEDAASFELGGTNRYEYVGNGPADAADPLGLWKIERSSRERQATATADKSTDTIQTLADLIGLGAEDSEWRNWLEIPAPGYVQLAPGQPFLAGTLETLQKTEVIRLCQKVLIPNTVVALKADKSWREFFDWNAHIAYLQRLGFAVDNHRYGETQVTVRGRSQELTSRTFVQRVEELSMKRQLHGLYAQGHGDPEGFGNADRKKFWVSYIDLSWALRYRLALVVLDVCHGGWSKNDVDVPGWFQFRNFYSTGPGDPGVRVEEWGFGPIKGNTIAAGGADLVSSSPAKVFWGKKRVVSGNVAVDWEELIKAPRQGTK